MHKVFIGIGSNLCDPQQQLNNAIEALKALSADKQLQSSAIYQSAPMAGMEQPDYLNAVACIRVTQSPLELLDALQAIENSQGRDRSAERWGARTLDLDLLLYDNDIINTERLTVPHYGIKQRNFVIYPLADIDADLVLPDGTSIRQLYLSCSSDGIIKIE